MSNRFKFEGMTEADFQGFQGADPGTVIAYTDDDNSEDACVCMITPLGEVQMIFTDDEFNHAIYSAKFPNDFTARLVMDQYPVGETCPEEWGFILINGKKTPETWPGAFKNGKFIGDPNFKGARLRVSSFAGAGKGKK